MFSKIKKWLRPAFLVLGVIAVSLIIWFFGPLLAIGTYRPLEGFWLRISIIAFLFSVLIAVYGWKLYKRHKAQKELEKAVAENQEPDSDADVLSEKMNDALQTLKKSSSTRGSYLYDLPWYIIIGPPGSGKTTALLNSGLRFPLATGGDPAAISGVGGTRYCDWWFAEEAVLIDTAGRYTTQDSDAAFDKKSWRAFLKMLSKNRPEQPINGVLVAISFEDLMVSSPDEIRAHADAIRRRLLELSEELKVDFPVYALFTKADLISGFMEYFGSFTEQRRNMVWGATFQTADKTQNLIGEVPHEFDLLIARLSEEIPDRLQEEVDPLSRVKLFGFPSQVASLKPAVVEFLNQIFEPTRYHTNASLRGFYFTSGTQEGTPIDRVLGAMSISFGEEGHSVPAYSGRAKSFFLGDLLKSVIFAEAGWVSMNLKAVRRAFWLRTAAFSAIAVGCVAAMGFWWVSYTANTELIKQTELAIADYSALAEPVMQETTVADTDFARTLVLLHKLRYLPVGYAYKDEEESWLSSFGLSQRDRLLSSSKEIYRVALERIFRSRMILRLEHQIERNKNDPVFVYEALKVYLMLGGKAPVKTDDALIKAWMEYDWADKLFPGPADRAAREELVQHLDAMLELDDTRPIEISLNKVLVENAQRILARLSLADRAYSMVRSQARVAPVEDWIASYRAGPDSRVVFETKDGADLDDVRVANLFTYDGFHDLFLGELTTIAEQLESERWVLGELAEQKAIEQQYKSLGPDLIDLYTKEFIKEWKTALERLKLVNLTADKPNFAALQAASAATSPIKLLVQSVRDETMLTQDRSASAEAEGSSAKDAGSALRRRYQSRLGGLSRIGLNIALKSQRRAGAASSRRLPGANIEAEFKRFHRLTDNEIDKLLNNFKGILDNLIYAGVDTSRKASASQQLARQVGQLRSNATRLPGILSAMILAAADEFEGDAAETDKAKLTSRLNNVVTRACSQIIENRYPFYSKSKRDVPLTEFAKLFQPNGIIDRFFSEYLSRLADVSGKEWKWREDVRLSRELSSSTLKQFQRAAEIMDAFFPTGGQIPQIKVTILPATLSRNATAAEMIIDGQKIESVHGIDTPKSIDWPSHLGDSRVSLDVLPQSFNQTTKVEFNGPWAFYRLLNYGRMSRRGDGLSVRYVIGGREVSYMIRVGSLKNPFALSALRRFRCPAGL